MAKPAPTQVQSSKQAFGSELHQFLELYEAAYPEEVVHIEEPLRAEWEITALAIKLEKAQRFPVLVCHNVIADGNRAELPLGMKGNKPHPRLMRSLKVGAETSVRGGLNDLDCLNDLNSS
jgi:hypothetical protein